MPPPAPLATEYVQTVMKRPMKMRRTPPQTVGGFLSGAPRLLLKGISRTLPKVTSRLRAQFLHCESSSRFRYPHRLQYHSVIVSTPPRDGRPALVTARRPRPLGGMLVAAFEGAGPTSRPQRVGKSERGGRRCSPAQGASPPG